MQISKMQVCAWKMEGISIVHFVVLEECFWILFHLAYIALVFSDQVPLTHWSPHARLCFFDVCVCVHFGQAKEGAILRTRTEIESLEEETAALKEALDDERLSMMEIIHEYHEKETALELQLHEFEERKVVLMVRHT